MIPCASAICVAIVVTFISRSFITWLVILLTELLDRDEIPSCVLTVKEKFNVGVIKPSLRYKKGTILLKLNKYETQSVEQPSYEEHIPTFSDSSAAERFSSATEIEKWNYQNCKSFFKGVSILDNENCGITSILFRFPCTFWLIKAHFRHNCEIV